MRRGWVAGSRSPAPPRRRRRGRRRPATGSRLASPGSRPSSPTCGVRSNRSRNERRDPIEQVAEDTCRRAPDDLAVRRVDVRAEGDAAAYEALALVALAQLGKRQLQDLRDLGG